MAYFWHVNCIYWHEYDRGWLRNLNICKNFVIVNKGPKETMTMVNFCPKNLLSNVIIEYEIFCGHLFHIFIVSSMVTFTLLNSVY